MMYCPSPTHIQMMTQIWYNLCILMAMLTMVVSAVSERSILNRYKFTTGLNVDSVTHIISCLGGTDHLELHE